MSFIFYAIQNSKGKWYHELGVREINFFSLVSMMKSLKISMMKSLKISMIYRFLK
jgi:hypothetical protein